MLPRGLPQERIVARVSMPDVGQDGELDSAGEREVFTQTDNRIIVECRPLDIVNMQVRKQQERVQTFLKAWSMISCRSVLGMRGNSSRRAASACALIAS